LNYTHYGTQGADVCQRPIDEHNPVMTYHGLSHFGFELPHKFLEFTAKLCRCGRDAANSLKGQTNARNQNAFGPLKTRAKNQKASNCATLKTSIVPNAPHSASSYCAKQPVYQTARIPSQHTRIRTSDSINEVQRVQEISGS